MYIDTHSVGYCSELCVTKTIIIQLCTIMSQDITFKQTYQLLDPIISSICCLSNNLKGLCMYNNTYNNNHCHH